MISLSRRVRPFLVLPTVSAVVSASAQPGGSAQITLPADAEILPMPAWDGLSPPELLSDPPRPPNGVRVRGVVRVTCNVRETGALDHCIVLPTGSTPADPVLQRMVDEWSAAARAKPAARHGEPVAIPFTFNFNQR